MKNLSAAVLFACIISCSVQVFAQTAISKALPLNEPDYNKPKLFADLPSQIDFNEQDFLDLFAMPIGATVKLRISAEFIFSGELTSKANDSTATTVVIRSTNRIGARFVFTRTTFGNGSPRYLGRIFSFGHSDGYELVPENNRYYFKKKSIYELISE